MPVAEYRSWMDFYQVEPWGDLRADLRAGIIASTFVRLMGAKGARPKPLDFMPIVAAQQQRKRARDGGAASELRAALMVGFKGRVKHIKLKGARHG